MRAILIIMMLGVTAMGGIRKSSVVSWSTTRASWYQVSCNSAGPGTSLGSRVTASGVMLDDGVLTCAHKTLRLGSVIEVLYGEKRVELLVTDRGPYVRGRGIDLGRKAAEELGIGSRGVVSVKWRVVGHVDLRRYVGGTARGWDESR